MRSGKLKIKNEDKMKIKVIILMLLVWRVVLAGGNFNNGSNAGLLNSNFNNSSSNANSNIGGHLYLKHIKTYPLGIITLPLGKKENSNHNSVSTIAGTLCWLQANQNNMKRYSHLFENIIAPENLATAFEKARKGKAHYREVREISKNPEHYLLKLHNLLKEGQYENSPYFIFERFTGHKLRKIYKLPFYPDRIVHHSIVQVMMPIWMNLFIRDTFATIPGRGIHDGVSRVKKALQDGPNTKYCLKMDVRKYYPSVDHDVLKLILQKQIKDSKLMHLLNTIIDSAPGIPIGNYISQWFGNVYLAYFDHFVKENLGIKYYFRYADDMVLLSNSKHELRQQKESIEKYLNENLKLSLKGNYQIFPVDARSIDFLGYRFYHTHVLVRKGVVKNFKKSIHNQKADKQTQSAYWGWFKYANTYNLTQKYFQT